MADKPKDTRFLIVGTIPRGIAEVTLEATAEELTSNFHCGRRALKLPIASQIVDAHGGRILLQTSHPKHYNCRRFVLPSGLKLRQFLLTHCKAKVAS